jgi:hypothetical protein
VWEKKVGSGVVESPESQSHQIRDANLDSKTHAIGALAVTRPDDLRRSDIQRQNQIVGSVTFVAVTEPMKRNRLGSMCNTAGLLWLVLDGWAFRIDG